MAIFSLHHSFIGRTTHAPGSASHYARYITRPEACTKVIGERMPTDPKKLIRWLDVQEQDDRKNARVIDKLVLALPIEFSREQNLALLHAFGERLTEGRASWVAALHDAGEDTGNPHAHIILRDRDFETGKRVMLTTESGSTERIREVWETEVNLALERACFEQRVSRLSLEEQGIDREPQIHVGAGAQAMERRGVELQSAERQSREIINGQITPVTINYPAIDGGMTRAEENQARIARNHERELAMLNPEMDWTGRGGLVAQQYSAMHWVRAAEARTSALYQTAMRGDDTSDADSIDLDEVRAHMRRYGHSPDGPASPSRQQDIAEAWEARTSQLSKTYLEEHEMQHDQALERDFEP